MRTVMAPIAAGGPPRTLSLMLPTVLAAMSALALVGAAASGARSLPETRTLDELAELAKQRYGGELGPMMSPLLGGKIEHFIVLLKENRAFDHIAGCMDLPGADSASTASKTRKLPKDPKNASAGHVEVTCGTASYACHGGPGASLWSQKFAKDGNPSTYPYSPQSDDNSYLQGAHGNAIEMFSKEQLPVKTAMAGAFGTFNKLFSSVPSASSPNHLFSQSATSCGVMTNVNYGGCNPDAVVTFPQLTVYDSMLLHNKSIAFYINLTETTNWTDNGKQNARTAPCSDAARGKGIMGGSEFPDICMDGIARHKRRFFNYSRFFRDAAAGTLPNFAMIQPNGSRCDHPCADLAMGERLDKDIYEALRAGPAWNKTLFLLLWVRPEPTSSTLTEGTPCPLAPRRTCKSPWYGCVRI